MDTERKSRLYKLLKEEFPLEQYNTTIKRAINLHSNIEVKEQYSLIKEYILSWYHKERKDSIESFDSHKIKL
jgi:hypothetical protein